MEEEEKYPKLKNENDEYPSSIIDDNFWELIEEKKSSKESNRKKLSNIKTHVDVLATKRMREHALSHATEHPIDFQVFRFLTGYEEALEEIEKQREIINFTKLTLEKHQTWTGQKWDQNHVADFEAAKILNKIEGMEE